MTSPTRDAEQAVRRAEMAWAMARGWDLKAPHWDDLAPEIRTAIITAITYTVELERARLRGIVEEATMIVSVGVDTGLTPKEEILSAIDALAAD